MADEEGLADNLGSVDVFSSMNKKARKALAKVMRTAEFSDGAEITGEGEMGVGFHLILDGTAVVEAGGQQRNQLGPGNYFGEISLIDGEPRSATVRATAPLRTAGITSWQFHSLLRENPEVMEGLLKGLCARLRAAEAKSG
jgi:CRP/FNR family transcriptional regulator, cyclic AMP receptor protein